MLKGYKELHHPDLIQPKSHDRKPHTQLYYMASLIDVELNEEQRFRYLWLQDNQLTGEIPSEMFNISDESGEGTLDYVDLSANQLSGELPSFENCHNLGFLDLGDNQLTGELTDDLFTVPSWSSRNGIQAIPNSNNYGSLRILNNQAHCF